MRPGCDRPAAARLSYDTISCQVWLDQMPERLGPVQEICQFHAERLTVPRGWTLCDRRVDAPALFEPDHRAVQLGEAATLAASGSNGAEVAEVIPVAPRRVAARGASTSTTAPRRSNRRRHPSSTARQLFDEGLDPELPPEPTIDLDSDLDPAPIVDLDADLDELVGDRAEPTTIEAVLTEVVAEVVVSEAVVEVVEAVAIEETVEESLEALVVEESVEVLVVEESVEVVIAAADVAPPVEPDEGAAGLTEVLVAAERTDRADRAERAGRAMPEHAEIMAEIVSVDLEDDLPESLRATSPLLARAFRATGPQRSVLSPDLASPADGDEDESAEA